MWHRVPRKILKRAKSADEEKLWQKMIPMNAQASDDSSTSTGEETDFHDESKTREKSKRANARKRFIARKRFLARKKAAASKKANSRGNSDGKWESVTLIKSNTCEMTAEIIEPEDCVPSSSAPMESKAYEEADARKETDVVIEPKACVEADVVKEPKAGGETDAPLEPKAGEEADEVMKPKAGEETVDVKEPKASEKADVPMKSNASKEIAGPLELNARQESNACEDSDGPKEFYVRDKSSARERVLSRSGPSKPPKAGRNKRKLLRNRLKKMARKPKPLNRDPHDVFGDYVAKELRNIKCKYHRARAKECIAAVLSRARVGRMHGFLLAMISDDDVPQPQLPAGTDDCEPDSYKSSSTSEAETDDWPKIE
ncbi:uncharacterized protein LOC113506008 isoform X1 [Trichoplusia ni]|uniref:Uncharacterized protein LOC113506008 isoform X1 n=2 Tax=Trichoplusia ni TaxID=7111 RepID=A0A7E5WV22_TRINI|nr:uncharacterized protein LOC113506008 isoform X1 [Trichoplusia ni]